MKRWYFFLYFNHHIHDSSFGLKASSLGLISARDSEFQNFFVTGTICPVLYPEVPQKEHSVLIHTDQCCTCLKIPKTFPMHPSCKDAACFNLRIFTRSSRVFSRKRMRLSSACSGPELPAFLRLMCHSSLFPDEDVVLSSAANSLCH
jgi:hypothetical protein